MSVTNMEAELQLLLDHPLLTVDSHGISGYANVRGTDCVVRVGDDHELRTRLDRLRRENLREVVNRSEHYRRVLAEYLEFRKFYIHAKESVLAEDLADISVIASDECGREHRLKIGASFDDGVTEFYVVDHELPGKEFAARCSSLSALYEKFLSALDELQPFFRDMECLDTTWVLDPQRPTTKDKHRRIALVLTRTDDNVSLVVTVDPWTRNDIPRIQFLGPERLVDKYRRRVSKNLPDWDVNANIVDELLKLLDIKEFPAKRLHSDGAVLYDAGDCCVCFSTVLDGKLPEISCENPACEQFFHKECLYKWLVSVVAQNKTCFNLVHGECPNCKNHISCPTSF